MKSTINIIALLLFILFPLNTIQGQDVKVRSSIDTTSILTGDQIWFTVSVEKPGDLILKLNRFKDTIISDIEIVRGPLSDTTRVDNGMEVITDRYLVTSFDSGRYEIPPVFAEMDSEDGIKRFYSDYQYLIVNRPEITPPDSTMKIFDIVGPYRAPLTAGEILPWLLILMAASIGIYFLVKYLKYRSKKGEPIPADDPQEAAHVIAYRNLEKLKSEKLWQNGFFKQYYSRLSEIVRIYIDMRFGMSSMESTTLEIMKDILNIELATGEASDALRQVLEVADMVKFAKFIPDESDCELSMEQAWSFVSLTRKEKQAPEIADESEMEVEL